MSETSTPENAPRHCLEDLVDVIRRLTAEEGGCPWDKEQTPDSLTEYVIEESHELVSAIRAKKDDEVCEELGDVLFLLLFITHLYEKKGAFSFCDVVKKNAAKMIHRHPHVFSGETFASLDEQLKAWETLKKEEHEQEGKPQGIFDSLPRNLDPLARAYRIHSKAARAGFTWEGLEDVEQQVETEWLEYVDARDRKDEDAVRHEIGDLVFSIVELGRRHNLKANAELDFANERFLSRFRFMEARAREAGRDLSSMTLEEMDAFWNEAKEAERKAAGKEAPKDAPQDAGSEADNPASGS